MGGGAKDYVPARTLRARNWTHFRQGPHKGPGSHIVVLMLSRAIWALLLNILIKDGLKTTVDPILGGAPVAPAAPWIRHCKMANGGHLKIEF